MDFRVLLDNPFTRKTACKAGETIVRTLINRMIEDVTPALLLEAINKDTSLWESCTGDIKDKKESLPSWLVDAGGNFTKLVNTEHGGFLPLTMKWLATDRPELLSIIINSEGGEQWLERNLYQILDGCGINARPTENAN